MRQWYALRSKPKKESAAAALLTRAKLEVYVPQVKVHRERSKPPVLEPFFPGYLFGRLDPLQGEIRLASYTPGILYVVGYGSEPCPLPDELVQSIQERLTRSRGRAALADFRPGDRVIVTGGPLKDVEAVFDSRLSATGRVRVLVKILERLCPAEIGVDYLRRAGKAAGAA